MDKVTIYSFVVRERYAVVSSVAEDGSPQSALVGIAVTPRLEVIFDTLKSSRKYSNLTQRAECSIVIGLGGPAAETTVQMEGVAEAIAGDELRRCLEVYLSAWPDGQERLKWKEISHFVVRPRWIRYSDFSKLPAVIEEFTMADRDFPPTVLRRQRA